MQATIQPSILKGTIQAPASKSSMQRACAAALVSGGQSIIKNPGYSNDDKAALGILKSVGCDWSMVNGELSVDSSNSFLMSGIGEPPTANGEQPRAISVNCGESGLGIRMFAPILALSKSEIIINGEGSLLKRPMDFFDDILPQLGVEIHSNHGRLPLKIKGSLTPKDIEIDGSLSSQFLTGLLFAYAASPNLSQGALKASPRQYPGEQDAERATIKVRDLKSKPYIDLTLTVMRDFGLNVPENKNYEEFCFISRPSYNGQQPIIRYSVEGDWSGGAFLLVAGAIAGNIVVKGLDTQSTQADKKIMEALKDCGTAIKIKEHEISIGSSGAEFRSFEFDATDCPDLFPPLVALASYCTGLTVIKGVNRLTHKESNRAITLQEEFGKMGVTIELRNDEMIINGGGKVKGAIVHSRHDHRIAMACAVAALKAAGETIIEEADAINKSYPDFYEHLKKLHAAISTNQLINQ